MNALLWNQWLNRITLAFLVAGAWVLLNANGSLAAAAGDAIDDSLYFPTAPPPAERKYKTRTTIHDGSVSESIETEKQEGSVTIGGKKYLQSTIHTPAHGRFKARTTTDYVRRAPDGVYQIHGKESSNAEYARLRFPMTIGKKWSVSIPAGGGGPASVAEMTVVGLEDVKVGGKTLKDCLHIIEKRKWADGKITESDEFYAPHIGYVKWRSKTGRTLVEIELVNP